MFLLPIYLYSDDSIKSPSTKIQQLVVFSETDYELIQLQSSVSFFEPISPHFDPGQIRLTIPQSEFTAEIENRYINDRFIKATKFYKEGKNSILEIHFSDSKFEAVGQVRTQIEKNNLNIYIDKTPHATSKIYQEEVFTPPQSNDVESQPFASNSDDLFDSTDLTVNIVKMLLALSGLLIVLYFVLWVYNRFFVAKFNVKRGDHRIKLVSSYHISPKQKIIILAINDKTFACGVTSNNISVISEISDNTFDKFISQFEYNREDTIDFSKLRAQYLASKQSKRQNDSPASKLSFSSELLKRVKRLKPID